ncbi:hypothetical protein [Hydrogenophaga sp. IBVHS1]|uniref:hypothetical protein n=1 Tax=unclassified Hydrogenophaga TaxID=2610897 RepID=UPI000A2DBA49|nr:hypothetical protein [Hydrogenophaga sp. IBVHS1]OSZ73144.1 hypothetical protein CAP37_15920 [Hydrogenophaga sp. IBVHS1]
MAKFNLRGAFAGADSKPINPRIVILATEAADQASLLAVMVKTYTALERIVTYDQDSLERAATREGLGSLIRALNVEMERQVGTLVHSTSALRDFALNECDGW